MGGRAAQWKAVVATVVIASAVAACSHTGYVDRAGSGLRTSTNLFERVVEYESDMALLLDYPRCIAVGKIMMPLVHNGRAVEELLREALVSRLRGRINDVTILDLGNRPDIDEIEVMLSGCIYLLAATVQAIDETYLLIWSRKRLAVDLRLLHLTDGSTLWKAHHIASRSEGDIPFSAVGAAVAMFRTKDFSDDADVLPSIIDDAVRRLISVFPMAAAK